MLHKYLYFKQKILSGQGSELFVYMLMNQNKWLTLSQFSRILISVCGLRTYSKKNHENRINRNTRTMVRDRIRWLRKYYWDRLCLQ